VNRLSVSFGFVTHFEQYSHFLLIAMNKKESIPMGSEVHILQAIEGEGEAQKTEDFTVSIPNN
jgi:hypothetical protein